MIKFFNNKKMYNVSYISLLKYDINQKRLIDKKVENNLNLRLDRSNNKEYKIENIKIISFIQRKLKINYNIYII